jgi:SAM-dependent methyltransferase
MSEDGTYATDRMRVTVIERFSAYARHAAEGGTPRDCDTQAFDDGSFGASAYSEPDAPHAALRASLGCGNPLAVADLNPGEVVLDLGSGGGLDVVLAARRVDPNGMVYGLDASPDMLALARGNAQAAGVDNVAFLPGTIEDIPLPNDHADVIISNCVINLSTDKARVLTEAFRVLRPGGRFGVSDVIASAGLDPVQRAAAERRVGCTVGTLTASEYRELLVESGFTEIRITPTADAGDGLGSAIVQATKPTVTTRHSPQQSQ